MSKFGPLRGSFWPFPGSKKSFFGFFESLFGVVQRLSIVFCLKMPTFRGIFRSKGWYITSKIKILGKNLALWEGHFDYFGAQKSRFLDILKVGLEMFRSCFGIIFGLKRRTVRCIFCLKGQYMTSKIKILDQNLALWEGHFDHFGAQ